MYVVSVFCGMETCGLYIVVPIMPWALILAQDLDMTFPWSVYPIFVLLNASVAYVLGASLEWGYHKYREYKEDTGRTVAQEEHTGR